jgi:hypothetical protein
VENEMNEMITTYAHVILHLLGSRSRRVGGVVERVREDYRSRRGRETRRKRRGNKSRKRRSGVYKMIRG